MQRPILTALVLFISCSCFAQLPEYISKWKGKEYDGEISVSVYSSYDSLDVEILTNDLLIRPISWDSLTDCVALFADPEIAMQENRLPWTPEETFEQLRKWIWRWEEGVDPFSAFTLFFQDDDHWTFAGYIVLDHGKVRGEAELKFAVVEKYRDRGLAKQAIQAILSEYAPFLHEKRFYVNLNDPYTFAAPLRTIRASVRGDNSYAIAALKRIGLSLDDEEIENGVYLKHYILSVEEFSE